MAKTRRTSTSHRAAASNPKNKQKSTVTPPSQGLGQLKNSAPITESTDDDKEFDEGLRRELQSRCEQIYEAAFGRPWVKADWPSGEQLKRQPLLAKKVVALLQEQQNKMVELLVEFETEVSDMLTQCEELTGATYSLLLVESKVLKQAHRALRDNIALLKDTWGRPTPDHCWCHRTVCPRFHCVERRSERTSRDGSESVLVTNIWLATSPGEEMFSRTCDMYFFARSRCEISVGGATHAICTLGQTIPCKSSVPVAVQPLLTLAPTPPRQRARAKPTLEDALVRPLDGLLEVDRHWLADRTIHDREWPLAFPQTMGALKPLLALLQGRGASLPAKRRGLEQLLQQSLNEGEPHLTNNQLGAVAILCGAYEIEIEDGDDAGSILRKASEDVRRARASLFARPDRKR